MKIAIICPNFPPARFEGGIAHYSHLLAKHLTMRGHEITAITSTEFSNSRLNLKQSENWKTIAVEGPWNQHTIESFKEIVSNRKIDVLVLQYSPVSFKASFRLKWAVSNFACPKVTAFHTLWGAGLDRIIGIMNLIGSKKIIATNSEIMTILKRRLPFLMRKTCWIPIASSILKINIEKYDNRNDSKIISYFGMLYPGKGLDLILDVVEELRRKNYNFYFKFIGGGMLNQEFYLKQFHAKIRERNLNDRVQLLGLIPENEVSKLLNRSRFVFLPFERGLSDRRSSLMAAIENEKAILTSPPVIDMPLFKNGENILWPKNPSLSEYIRLAEEMLIDDELIRRLEKGAKKLSCNFGWEKITSDYETALQI